MSRWRRKLDPVVADRNREDRARKRRAARQKVNRKRRGQAVVFHVTQTDAD